MEEKKTVQMEMLDSTLEKIEEMRKILNTQNRSEIVRTSIDVTEMITKAIEDGGSIIVQKKNGEQMKLTIPGIT